MCRTNSPRPTRPVPAPRNQTAGAIQGTRPRRNPRPRCRAPVATVIPGASFGVKRFVDMLFGSSCGGFDEQSRKAPSPPGIVTERRIGENVHAFSIAPIAQLGEARSPTGESKPHTWLWQQRTPKPAGFGLGNPRSAVSTALVVRRTTSTPQRCLINN